MNSLFLKIFILFFLIIPLFLEAEPAFAKAMADKIDFDVNFGSQVYEDSEVPVILPRAIWENTAELENLLNWYPEEVSSESEEVSLPDYSSVQRIIIHDMGCNAKDPGCNDKELDPLIIIQNIYRYHAVTRGLGDIGYHYIIDYWGNIYEGRYGGNGVRGAHTYYDKKCDNFNVGSIGILLIGNYNDTELPEVMYNSLIRLIAWLAATNDLDPEELYHFSKVWHSPKKDSGCDISQGGLISAYIGPVVVGHNDIEEGNIDPGLVDLNKVRQEAGELKIKKVILNKNQLDAFPSASKKIYPDNTLVKSHTRDRVFLIKDNKKHPIFSENLFNLRGYDWQSVVSLSDRDLAIYPLGLPITYPNGSLIKGDGPEVYVIENQARRHITSRILFKQKEFKWEDVMEVSQAELLTHPLGEKVLFIDGSLVKEEKSLPVYLIKSQERHWIENPQVFSGLGYKWRDIITLSSEEISHYMIGSVISAVK